MIADSLGIEYPKQVLAGLSVHEKRVMAVRLNASRRQLTDAQKIILGRQIEPDIAEIARNRMRTGTLSHDQDRVEPKHHRTTDYQVAKDVGT